MPFGFAPAADQTTLLAVEDEQEALGLIRRLRHDGLSLRRIASELQAREIRTNSGCCWSHSTLQTILARTRGLPR